MRKFQQQRRWRRIFSSLVVVMGLMALFGWMLYSTASAWQKKAVLQKELTRLQQQIGEIESNKSQLREDLARTSDPDVIDYEARNRLNVKAAGEEVLVIVDQQQQKSSVPSQKNFLKNFLDLFR